MTLYYLAIVFFLSFETEPIIIDGPLKQEECRVIADKQNRNNPVMRDKKVREMGGEFVCLKVERVYL